MNYIDKTCPGCGSTFKQKVVSRHETPEWGICRECVAKIYPVEEIKKQLALEKVIHDNIR